MAFPGFSYDLGKSLSMEVVLEKAEELSNLAILQKIEIYSKESYNELTTVAISQLLRQRAWLNLFFFWPSSICVLEKDAVKRESLD